MAETRKFVDSEGIHWQVYELHDDAGVGALPSERWLYFFARGATRSLSAYPDDWALMDWRGLERLCRYASPPVARDRASPRVIAHGAEI